ASTSITIVYRSRYQLSIPSATAGSQAMTTSGLNAATVDLDRAHAGDRPPGSVDDDGVDKARRASIPSSISDSVNLAARSVVVSAPAATITTGRRVKSGRPLGSASTSSPVCEADTSATTAPASRITTAPLISSTAPLTT